MKRNIVKQALIVALATVAITAAAIAAPVKKKTIKRAPASSAPKVSFIVNGKLMTQSVNGGAVRAATAAEKSKWQNSPKTSAISPDGKLEVKKEVIPGGRFGSDPYVSFKVVQRGNGGIVFHPRQISDRISAAVEGSWHVSIRFDYWLPDSKHIAFTTTYGMSSSKTYSHYTMNVYTREFLPFTGWIAPNGKIAIASEKEYNAEDDIPSGIDNGPGYVSRISNGKWYVVQIPKGFASYRFKTASKKQLIGPKSLVIETDPIYVKRVIKGDYAWFPLTAYILADFAGAARREEPLELTHIPVIAFSKDSKWAVGGGEKGLDLDVSGIVKDKRSGYFLMSMTTGKVRKLPGIQARFTN